MASNRRRHSTCRWWLDWATEMFQFHGSFEPWAVGFDTRHLLTKPESKWVADPNAVVTCNNINGMTSIRNDSMSFWVFQ